MFGGLKMYSKFHFTTRKQHLNSFGNGILNRNRHLLCYVRM